MKDYTINNSIALLEEVTHNGKSGKDTLYAWFLGEQSLIERTIIELNASQPVVEADAQMEKADEYSRKLATHLYHMGVARIEEDIYIFETPDVFRLTLERIKTAESYECKCGEVEEINGDYDIEWHICQKCKRRGEWKQQYKKF